MKKVFLLMLALFLSIGCVFAIPGYGKVLVGGNIGYYPSVKLTQVGAQARWLMDYDAYPEFTTDVAAEVGAITDFKSDPVVDAYLGAGLTFKIGDGWDVYGNCGLDMIAEKGATQLGVAAVFGIDYTVMERLQVNAGIKVAEYFTSRQVLYRPTIGAVYTF